jgi:hypothetical protein
LDVSEFQHAIKLGLGRAILHLQNHDAAPYRDVILQACLKNTIRDRQIEGDKATYMMDIINLTGEKDFYRHHILNAAKKIDKDTDSYDSEHLLDLVQAFANDGDTEARQIIYNAFNNNLTTDDEWCAYRLIELDDVVGFTVVAEQLGQLVKTNSEFYADDFLLSELEEQIGKDIATEKLQKVRLENRNVDVYLTAVEAIRDNRQQNKINRKAAGKRVNQTYEQIKQLIENEKGQNLVSWGKDADEESLMQAAIDLVDVLQQNDITRLRKQLQIFRKAPFPLAPQSLFKLIYYEDEVKYPPLPVSLLNMLKNVAHPSVREFALKLIAENRFTGRAVGILQNNLEAGDWQLIVETTKRTLDDEDYHSLEMSVRDIFSKHPSTEAAQTLLNLYEYGICSFCRGFMVEALHSIDALPDSIREECHYDSSEYTRALLKRNFEPETK